MKKNNIIYIIAIFSFVKSGYAMKSSHKKEQEEGTSEHKGYFKKREKEEGLTPQEKKHHDALQGKLTDQEIISSQKKRDDLKKELEECERKKGDIGYEIFSEREKINKASMEKKLVGEAENNIEKLKQQEKEIDLKIKHHIRHISDLESIINHIMNERRDETDGEGDHILSLQEKNKMTKTSEEQDEKNKKAQKLEKVYREARHLLAVPKWKNSIEWLFLQSNDLSVKNFRQEKNRLEEELQNNPQEVEKIKQAITRVEEKIKNTLVEGLKKRLAEKWKNAREVMSNLRRIEYEIRKHTLYDEQEEKYEKTRNDINESMEEIDQEIKNDFSVLLNRISEPEKSLMTGRYYKLLRERKELFHKREEFLTLIEETYSASHMEEADELTLKIREKDDEIIRICLGIKEEPITPHLVITQNQPSTLEEDAQRQLQGKDISFMTSEAIREEPWIKEGEQAHALIKKLEKEQDPMAERIIKEFEEQQSIDPIVIAHKTKDDFQKYCEKAMEIAYKKAEVWVQASTDEDSRRVEFSFTSQLNTLHEELSGLRAELLLPETQPETKALIKEEILKRKERIQMVVDVEWKKELMKKWSRKKYILKNLMNAEYEIHKTDILSEMKKFLKKEEDTKKQKKRKEKQKTIMKNIYSCIDAIQSSLKKNSMDEQKKLSEEHAYLMQQKMKKLWEERTELLKKRNIVLRSMEETKSFLKIEEADKLHMMLSKKDDEIIYESLGYEEDDFPQIKATLKMRGFEDLPGVFWKNLEEEEELETLLQKELREKNQHNILRAQPSLDVEAQKRGKFIEKIMKLFEEKYKQEKVLIIQKKDVQEKINSLNKRIDAVTKDIPQMALQRNLSQEMANQIIEKVTTMTIEREELLHTRDLFLSQVNETKNCFKKREIEKIENIEKAAQKMTQEIFSRYLGVEETAQGVWRRSDGTHSMTTAAREEFPWKEEEKKE